MPNINIVKTAQELIYLNSNNNMKEIVYTNKDEKLKIEFNKISENEKTKNNNINVFSSGYNNIRDMENSIIDNIESNNNVVE